MVLHLFFGGDEQTALGIERPQQVGPQIGIIQQVLLHDGLPFAERRLAHVEETFRVENLLDLHLVVMLNALLCVRHGFEQLCEQLLI